MDERWRYFKTRLVDLLTTLPRTASAEQRDKELLKTWASFETQGQGAPMEASVSRLSLHTPQAKQLTEAEAREARLGHLIDDTFVPGSAAEKMVTCWMNGGSSSAPHICCSYCPLEDSVSVTSNEPPAISPHGRFIWVMRTAPRVDCQDPAFSDTMVFSVTDGEPVPHEAKLIRDVFLPLLKRQSSWGNLEQETRAHLSKECGVFQESVEKALGGGGAGDLSFDAVDPLTCQKIEEFNGSHLRASRDPSIVGKLGFYARRWAGEIRTLLHDRPPLSGVLPENLPEAHGPAADIQWWSDRLVRLTVATQFLGSPEAVQAKGILTLSLDSSDVQAVSSLDDMDLRLTDALNTAKEHVKYLASLGKFMDALYAGPPSVIESILPAMMSHVQLMSTICRYYTGEQFSGAGEQQQQHQQNPGDPAGDTTKEGGRGSAGNRARSSKHAVRRNLPRRSGSALGVEDVGFSLGEMSLVGVDANSVKLGGPDTQQPAGCAAAGAESASASRRGTEVSGGGGGGVAPPECASDVRLERMARLLCLITNRIIATCKDHIKEGGKLWQQAQGCDGGVTHLLQKLHASRHLRDTLSSTYERCRLKTSDAPNLPPFDFPVRRIFGKMDLFCRRVDKLIDVFKKMEQFCALEASNITGIEQVTCKFDDIVEILKKSTSGGIEGSADLLDYSHPGFDKAYNDFGKRILELESSLQVFINSKFEHITGTDAALELLHKFQKVIHDPEGKYDLESKYTIVMHHHALVIEHVQKLFEKQKAKPPISRNQPRVAGTIAWARLLLRWIEKPMALFQRKKTTLQVGTSQHRDCKITVKHYNRLARALVEFEQLWYNTWLGSVATIHQGLNATLLIRDGDALLVNLDPEVMTVAREAAAMVRMSHPQLPVPPEVKSLLMQRHKFKIFHAELSYVVGERDRVRAKIPPLLKCVAGKLVAEMDVASRQGETLLTWNSLNIDAFVSKFSEAIRRVDVVVTKLGDIVANRIQRNLKLITTSAVLSIPQDSAVTLYEFLSTQEISITTAVRRLEVKCKEIEHGVDSIADIVSHYERCERDTPHVGHIAAPALSAPHASGLHGGSGSSGSAQPAPPRSAAFLRLKAHFFGLMLKAVAAMLTKSLKVMHRRISTKNRGMGFMTMEQPFFEANVELAQSHVVLHPSIEELQRGISSVAHAVFDSTKSIASWADVPGAQSNIFDEISKTPELLKALKALDDQRGEGALLGLRGHVASYLSSFDRYQSLWGEDQQGAFHNFLKGKPALPQFEAKLKQYSEEAEVDKAMTLSHTIGCLRLETRALVKSLKQAAAGWRLLYANHLHTAATGALDAITNEIGDYQKQLLADPDTLDAFRALMGTLTEIREKESEMRYRFSPVQDTFDMLRRPKYGLQIVTAEEYERVAELQSEWRRLRALCDRRGDWVSSMQSGFKQDLIHSVQRFCVSLTVFRNDFDANGPMVKGIPPEEAMNRLRRYTRLFEDRLRAYRALSAGERLFGLPMHRFAVLTKTGKELGHLEKLYTLYICVRQKIAKFGETLWADIRNPGVLEAFEAECQVFMQQCRALPRGLKQWEAYKELENTVRKFGLLRPVVACLATEFLKPRHWQELMEATGSTWRLDPDQFRLRHLVEANIINHVEVVEEVSMRAEKECQVDTAIERILDDWNERRFQFDEWRGRGLLLLKTSAVVEIKESLEESQLFLSGINPKYLEPFREVVKVTMHRLVTADRVIDLWLEVQQNWQSLEAVFSGGDITKQMPTEAKKFNQIDKQWCKLMAKSQESSIVLQYCSDSDLMGTLVPMRDGLEALQRQLSAYLETKKRAFPRFYFVADKELLEILSQASDPTAIQGYVNKLFDGVANITFARSKQRESGKAELQAASLGSSEGETLHLVDNVRCAGHVEEWLCDLVREMQFTVKARVSQIAIDIGNVRRTEPPLFFNQGYMQALMDTFPAQCVLLALQILWTADITDYVTSPKQERHAKARELGREGMREGRFNEILEFLIRRTRETALSARQRTSVETLITIHEHQVEVWRKSIYGTRSQPRDRNSFEWLKQNRFYFNPDKEVAVISICDTDKEYSNEYLGVKERLVVTPLTDRCYITLSQALAMKLGGAPTGPAGTGKTETTKDLGRTYGIYVVVFNCSDQMDRHSMGKIVKGLAQANAWGCFDEFNRINLPVLSVVAQQMECVLKALKEHRSEFRFVDDHICPLKPGVGYFITMNPGYAGRQELPENLKILFRGVAMMVPDRNIIIRVKLASAGYTEKDVLCEKFSHLYKLCEQQLSKQRHYDFGLRNILSVLRSSGTRLRQAMSSSKAKEGRDFEESLFMHVLLDMNMSKLVYADVQLFCDLLQDIFPGKSIEHTSDASLVSGVKSAWENDMGYVFHRRLFNKAFQLHELFKVRHGLMVVGPSMCGKSSIYEALQRSLSEEQARIQIVRMYPKAITAQEMFGRIDSATGDWYDGVFSHIWKKAVLVRSGSVWITCDGPVDAVWVENLNTVLDDNKLLTLAGGDRIPMTPFMKCCFEVHSLDNASPATVSRAGIVYISERELGWEPTIRAKLYAKDSFKSGLVPRDACMTLHKRVADTLCTFFTSGVPQTFVTPDGRPLSVHPQHQPKEKLDHPPAPRSHPAASVKLGASVRAHPQQQQARQVPPAQPAAVPPDAQQVSRGGSLTPPPALYAADTIEKLWGATAKQCRQAFQASCVQVVGAAYNIVASLVKQAAAVDPDIEGWDDDFLARMFWFSLVWSFGGLLEADEGGAAPAPDTAAPATQQEGAAETAGGDVAESRALHASKGRLRFDFLVRQLTDVFNGLPQHETVFDRFLDLRTREWVPWGSVVSPTSLPPQGPDGRLSFSQLFIPTVDSARLHYLVQSNFVVGRPTLIVGVTGTAKTVGVTHFLEAIRQNPVVADPHCWTYKTLNFSYATTPKMLYDAVGELVEKRVGSRGFAPKREKKLVLFIDDINMPEVNEWGDQVTNEILRQLIAEGGMYSTDKDCEFQTYIDLAYIACMSRPGAGNNDVPSRLKRHFTATSVPLPQDSSLQKIYDTILQSQFSNTVYPPEVRWVSEQLPRLSIQCWKAISRKMLPTPAKFHYIFSMRDLSALFQGLLLADPCIFFAKGAAPQEPRGSPAPLQQQRPHTTLGVEAATLLIRLWKHESTRVFADKLADAEDKAWFDTMIENATASAFQETPFGVDLSQGVPRASYFVDFMATADINPDTGKIGGQELSAHRSYAPVASLAQLKDKVRSALQVFNAVEGKVKRLDLVLFDSAVKHIVRISRVLALARGNMLLVGVGGSGKTSLTRLSAFIADHHIAQIGSGQSYGVQQLCDDLREMYKMAGLRKPVTFILPDTDISQERFLEYINTFLSTGEIPGLWEKDPAEREEILQMTLNIAQKELGAKCESSSEFLYKEFIRRVRDSLHVVLCFSPANGMFRSRARRFPAIISNCAINWFFPWPREALLEVATVQLKDFNLAEGQSSQVRPHLLAGLATFHEILVQQSSEFLTRFRRVVCTTPRSFITLLRTYQSVYTTKHSTVQEGATKLTQGLAKLQEAGLMIQVMRKELDAQQKALLISKSEIQHQLVEVKEASDAAAVTEEEVTRVKDALAVDAAKVQAKKDEADKELEAALPALEEAKQAANDITSADLKELQGSANNPAHLTRVVMDGVMLLMHYSVIHPVSCTDLRKGGRLLGKGNGFITPSWDLRGAPDPKFTHAPYGGGGKKFITNGDCVKFILDFTERRKDHINEETCELLDPYLDLPVFTQDDAWSTSHALGGLCKWVISMRNYIRIARHVEPKMEKLRAMKAELHAAKAKLRDKEAELAIVNAEKQKQSAALQSKEEELARMEQSAQDTLRKVNVADRLIDDLKGEKDRWIEQATRNTSILKRLVGDVLLASAFITYCGAFNFDFRAYVFNKVLVKECEALRIPVSDEVRVGKQLVSFLASNEEVSDWQVQGLPSDEHSLQNAIILTRNALADTPRYSLLIDPQGQGLSWLKNAVFPSRLQEDDAAGSEAADQAPMCRGNVPAELLDAGKDDTPSVKVVQPNDRRLMHYVQGQVEAGKTLIVEGVGDTIDPVFDPILEHCIVKGRTAYIPVHTETGGSLRLEYHPDFKLLFTTKHPNPTLAPELFAKVCVIDFSVTVTGLEEQLLNDVIGKEKHELQCERMSLIVNMNANRRLLGLLEDRLLTQLSGSKTNLIDDDDLIATLAENKVKLAELLEKQRIAADTRQRLDAASAEYLPVAVRGSALYFVIVEMAMVNPMYQSSLAQFRHLFDRAVDEVDPTMLGVRRIDAIVTRLTQLVFAFVDCGLYIRHKLLFVFLIACRVLRRAGTLSDADFQTFLKGGAAVQMSDLRPKVLEWLPDRVWFHLAAASQSSKSKYIEALPTTINTNEKAWKAWFDHDTPEKLPLPDSDSRPLTPFEKLLVVRCVREDRTMLAARDFICCTLGSEYATSPAINLSELAEVTRPLTPVIFLLSPGSDPTQMITSMARRQRKRVREISMGEGQEAKAMSVVQQALQAGEWALLQNCHLSIDFLSALEQFLVAAGAGEAALPGDVHPDARLWITGEPTQRFPIGLLQLGIKLTNEPPVGIKAGLRRTFASGSGLATQELLDTFRRPDWKPVLFAAAFLHSLVQERRKFGPIGFCIPYEFNAGDLLASFMFLSNHFTYIGDDVRKDRSGSQVNWDTIGFMLSQILYGGRITDQKDQELFNVIVASTMNNDILSEGYQFAEGFRMPVYDEISKYRHMLESYPDVDPPEVFGLHPNAEVVYRQQMVQQVLDTIINIQPKEAATGSSCTREQLVNKEAARMLESLPQKWTPLTMDEARQRLGRVGAPNSNVYMPLTIFCLQEVKRLNSAICVVRNTLQDIALAIAGTIVMTPELQSILDGVYDARVPEQWVCVTWSSTLLGEWWSTLLRRYEQLDRWMRDDRPSKYWVSGFYKPQGFLTSVLQEVTRLHAKDANAWSLDEAVIVTEVTKIDPTDTDRHPSEGVYMYGLFLDGGGWDKARQRIRDPAPKAEPTRMPLIHVTSEPAGRTAPQGKGEKKARTIACPVYRYACRQSQNWVFDCTLPIADDDSPSKWIRRGVCLLLQRD